MNKYIRTVYFSLMLLVAASIKLSAQTVVNSVPNLVSEIGSAGSGATIILDAGFTSANATITLPNADITIDAGNIIWNAGNIKITNSGTGHLTFKNLKMDGTSISGSLFTNDASNGKLTLERCEFYNATGGAIDISTSGSATTTISYIKIYDNKAGRGPAVWMGENKTSNLLINNSTIENNSGTAAGYEGGAIASKFYMGNLEINNTVFRNNVSNV